MSPETLAVLFSAFVLVMVIVANRALGGAKMMCTACGTVGNGKTQALGSLVMEIALWVCFLIPGLIYSVWRTTTTDVACHKCGSTALVPMDSPVAQYARPPIASAPNEPQAPKTKKPLGRREEQVPELR